MMCSDQPDRQSVQAFRLVLLVAEVLVEGETVLVVSGLLVKKVMTPHGSVMLDQEEEMVLSSSALDATWCFWGLFSCLGWAGRHQHLFVRFWSSPIFQFAVTITKIS